MNVAKRNNRTLRAQTSVELSARIEPGYKFDDAGLQSINLANYRFLDLKHRTFPLD